MKNLHLIPTDKLSILISSGKEFNILNYPVVDKRCKHIYITSDEEIKPNKYALINGVLCKTELLEDRIVSRPLGYGGTMDICKSEYSEITITTDQDLITNGVQAIDDEFLEWFVKNPSCEFVEVENMACSGYKIIIPKEEPKQEIIEDKIYQAIGLSANKQGIINQALATSKVMDILKKEIIVKQETLEEAAERYEETDFNTTPTEETSQMMIQRAFINGVKWQQERSYSEAIEFIEWINDPINPFIKHNNKWIQACGNSTSWTTKELFEQFKKK